MLNSRSLNDQELKEIDNFDEIQRREREIIEIQTGILDINNLSKDLAIIVSSQGEMIDNIERNIEKTCQHTHQGVQELKTASNTQSSCVIS